MRSFQVSVLRLSLALAALAATATADEGQWQPHQMPQLKAELKRIGLNISAEQLADLSRHPMSAIVSTGGCSASFVSPDGLVVTNHHCAYGAIQRNSTAEKNWLANGFLAKSRAEELPAGPNERIYVTDKVEDVTTRVLEGLDAKLSGRERYDAIQKRIKALIAECESDPAWRCSVPVFHRGAEYYRIRQMMIRDVRLVYAPAEMIGNYGGDIDNYEWPRHTGDFSFLRAYVGKDGKPADPSPDNIPYRPKDFLTVSAEGLKNGDPILLAGYPGRTSRYKLPSEIRFARDIDYPVRVNEFMADLDSIAKATQGNNESAVRYASVVKGINNRMKKLQGLLDGFKRKDIAAIKDAQQTEFRAWQSKQSDAAQQATLQSELESLIAEDMALTQQEFAWSVATHSDLLRSALSLHRWAMEQSKADADRESGYQERDRAFLKARMNRLQQSFLPDVDTARWQAALSRYRALPAAMQIPAIQALLPANAMAVTALYGNTQLHKAESRLAWMEKPASAFAQDADALIRLAAQLQDTALKLEQQRKEIDGRLDALVPKTMRALIAWKQSQGKPVYPDANSTLRMTYGTVSPYSPRDGLTKGPFTTVEGILEKHTGADPFDAPTTLRGAIQDKRFGAFFDKTLNTVPVNFLSSADTTGGNSGSAILNRNGDLIGLNFDSTYESITKDWYFDPVNTRAIHVDIRYMLWIMKEVDKADNVLQEMRIKYPNNKK